jgi:hypothetical protein
VRHTNILKVFNLHRLKRSSQHSYDAKKNRREGGGLSRISGMHYTYNPESGEVLGSDHEAAEDRRQHTREPRSHCKQIKRKYRRDECENECLSH